MEILISKIAELQQYLPVQMTSDIEVVLPFLVNATSAHLLPSIGKEQYDVLTSAYKTAGKNIDAIEDETIKEAVIRSQAVIANLGYFYAVPVLSVKIGNAGIQIFSSETTKQAFNWQVDDLKKSLLELGFGALEHLMVYLHEEIDGFPQYAASAGYQASQQLLIRDARDFSKHFNIADSRYVYSTIVYIMRRVEIQSAQKLFSVKFYRSLKEPELPDAKQILVDEYVKPGLALLTAAKAIRERIITFEHGVASVNLIGNYNTAERQITPSADQLSQVTAQLEADGNQFLSDGLDYVLANPDDFIDFEQPLTIANRNIKNRKDSGIYAN